MDVKLGRPIGLPARDFDCVLLGGAKLEISFHRTVRVVDNDQISDMPPDMGRMPLLRVDQFNRVPDEVAKRRGMMIPMYQREALIIQFKSSVPFAIKIWIGGINAISGCACSEDPIVTYMRMEALQHQDYIITPEQKWIDGCCVDSGLTRQFVAMPVGGSFSAESQINGSDEVRGIQFEVIPSIGVVPLTPDLPVFQIFVKALGGRITTLDVTEETGICQVKLMIESIDGFPPDRQTLIYGGGTMVVGTLKKFGIEENATIHLALRLRGGRWAPEPEMNLAIGGYIRQKIIADTYDPSIWDVDRAACFNVHILNSESFGRITGYPLPPTPLDAESYAKLNPPYLKDLEEPVMANVQSDGVWKHGKSIAQILGINDKSVEIKADPVDPLRAFNAFSLMKAEMERRLEYSIDGDGYTEDMRGKKEKKRKRCISM